MASSVTFFKDEFIVFMQKLHKELTKTRAKEIIDIFTSSVEDAVSKNKEVKLIGFGTFGINDIPERKGRDPQSGESMVVPRHFQIKFRAGERLKKACRKIKIESAQANKQKSAVGK